MRGEARPKSAGRASSVSLCRSASPTAVVSSRAEQRITPKPDIGYSTPKGPPIVIPPHPKMAGPFITPGHFWVGRYKDRVPFGGLGSPNRVCLAEVWPASGGGRR